MVRVRSVMSGALIISAACQPPQAGSRTGGETVASEDDARGSAVSSTPSPPSPRGTKGDVLPTSHPAANFDQYARHYAGATYEVLSRELGVSPNFNKLSFVPTQTQYFERVKTALAMTPNEIETFRERGVVSIDHGQHEAMGSLYYSIWSRELPVLITSDSILHALHRSYDAVLEELEMTLFFERIDGALGKLSAQVGAFKSEEAAVELQQNLQDVDLYVTVARNLLAGAGDPDDVLGARTKPGSNQPDQLLVEPNIVTPNEVKRVLGLIASLTLQTPDNPTAIFGGRRPVDYSQFKPRGHYEEVPMLRRYFRAMMWLGRADLGFSLTRPAGITGWTVDLIRERRDAALMLRLIERTDALQQLKSVSDVIDFMVGHSDNPTPDELIAALEVANLVEFSDLQHAENLERWANVVNEGRKTSLIRSQVQGAAPDGPKTPLASYMQLFGQRFVLDSFMLSNLVYDSITFQGVKPERMMPKGLDVMAAFGNNYATALLRPELEQFNYSANLLAARKVTQDYDATQSWESDVYGLWLDTLRTLHQPELGQFFPQVMTTPAWEAKQLQTQLSSWAELRHDTILYAKQSYSSFPLCGYPRGYVEPYPKFFQRLTVLAREAALRLSELDVSSSDVGRTVGLTRVRDQRVQFFDNFAKTTERLGALAAKELRGEPFTSDEEQFLQDTVQIESPSGSGGPRYDGWYSSLLYNVAPDESAPTIADVHTDPLSGMVLEVGVGDPNFLVVAIDNGTDHATYVGPAYSYYEFAQPASSRLTDTEWEQMLESQPPTRAAWTSSFVAPAKRRTMAGKSTRFEEAPKKAVRRSERARLQLKIAAENARLRELERVLAIATTERDRAAHQRAIDAIKRAKCARTNPFRLEAVDGALRAASERASACFKATTTAVGCNTGVSVYFEPSGKKSVVYEPSPGMDDAVHACVVRAFGAVHAPKFCGEAVLRNQYVRCWREAAPDTVND